MKKIMMTLATIAFSFNAMAFGDLVVTEVSIKTPLPTGLESMAQLPPEKGAFAQMVFNNEDVKPLLDAAAELHKDKIADNLAAGGFFYQEGSYVVDCSQDFKTWAVDMTGYCSFEMKKSFGWYADLDLSFEVKGFVKLEALPLGTQFYDGTQMVLKK